MQLSLLTEVSSWLQCHHHCWLSFLLLVHAILAVGCCFFFSSMTSLLTVTYYCLQCNIEDQLLLLSLFNVISVVGCCFFLSSLPSFSAAYSSFLQCHLHFLAIASLLYGHLCVWLLLLLHFNDIVILLFLGPPSLAATYSPFLQHIHYCWLLLLSSSMQIFLAVILFFNAIIIAGCHSSFLQCHCCCWLGFSFSSMRLSSLAEASSFVKCYHCC